MKNLILSITASIALILPLYSHAEERVGKAVFETSAELGLKLTEKAIKNIEVKTSKLVVGSEFTVAPDSIVHYQNQVGVYRLRDGWYKLIKVQIIKKDERQVNIRSSELKAGDELVTHGGDLLRVAEMDAFGAGE